MTTFEGCDNPEQAHDSRGDRSDPDQGEADNGVPKTRSVIILVCSQTARDERPEHKEKSEYSKQPSSVEVSRR